MFTHGSVNTHMLSSVYTLLTFIVCAKPVNLLHFYQPMIYATCYIIFSAIWHSTGNDPVYSILDWDKPAATTRTTLIILLIGVPVLHFVTFASYTFKKWITEKLNCTGNTQQKSEPPLEKEVTSRDVEFHLQHNNSVHPS